MLQKSMKARMKEKTKTRLVLGVVCSVVVQLNGAAHKSAGGRALEEGTWGYKKGGGTLDGTSS